MNEIDKVVNQLANVMNWLRSGKENEDIREAMYSSAAKICRELADRIDNLNTTTKK